MVEAGGSIDGLAALTKVHARRTGNNPADLRQLEAKLFGESTHVDVWRRNHDFVFFARACRLGNGNAGHARNAVGVDLDSHLARRRYVREIRRKAIRDVDCRCRAARRQSDGSVNPWNWMSEARSIPISRLPPSA